MFLLLLLHSHSVRSCYPVLQTVVLLSSRVASTHQVLRPRTKIVETPKIVPEPNSPSQNAKTSVSDLKTPIPDSKIEPSVLLPLEFEDRTPSNTQNPKIVNLTSIPMDVVYKGRVPGVYEEWMDCHQQVDKFSGNNYKGYATREEAVAKWRRHMWKKNQTKILVSLLLTGIAVTVYYILS